MIEIADLVRHNQKRRIKAGLGFAIVAASLWGLWYVSCTAIWYAPTFRSEVIPPGTIGFLASAIVISAFNALWMVILVGIIWLSVLRKWGEFCRTFKQIKIAKWYFLAALFAGPMGIFGSFLAIGKIGGVFGAAVALSNPIIGAFLAKVWYKEKVTSRVFLGIIMLIIGGIFVWNPVELIDNIQNPATPDGLWLGYLGGFMAGTGWGIEGAIVGQAFDVSDPEVGVVIRFLAETIWWFIIILPMATLFLGVNMFDIALATATDSYSMMWLALAGLTLGFSCVFWYKSFTLIGVGRGQALSLLFVVVAIISLVVFMDVAVQWWIIAGVIASIIGAFIIWRESSEQKIGESLRTITS